MYCQKCGNSLLKNAKFCSKCGSSIQTEKIHIPKTNHDIEKLKKNIFNTGRSLFAIGWITIIVNIGLYLWSILDKSFSNLGISAPSLVNLYVITVLSIVLIILGSRIKKVRDKNINNYLLVSAGISLLFLLFSLLTGGRIGILFILLIIYLISSIISFKKLKKIDEFSSTLNSPEYKMDNKNWLIFIVSAFALLFVFITIIEPIIIKLDDQNHILKNDQQKITLNYDNQTEDYSDNAVFTDGSIPTTWDIAGITDPVAFKKYLITLQSAILSFDKETVIVLVGRKIGNEEYIRANYYSLFNAKVVDAFKNMNVHEIFRNYQGAMIGNGVVWFGQKEDGTFFISAINNDDDWFNFSSPKDNFNILFPAKPIFDSNSIHIESPKGTISWNSYESEDNAGNSYFVYKYSFSDGLNNLRTDEFLTTLLNNMVKTDGVDRLVSSSFGYLSSYRTLNFEILYKNEGVVKGKYVYARDTPYLILMNYYPVNYNVTNYNNFINSFEIN